MGSLIFRDPVSATQNSAIVDLGSTSGLAIQTSGSIERLRIDANGNVSVNGAMTSVRVNPRILSTANTSSITPDISLYDQYAVTALAVPLTINAPTGNPADGSKIMIRLEDNGTGRALTWNSTYIPIAVTLPTTTVANKTTYVGCIYNSANSSWDVIAVGTQA